MRSVFKIKKTSISLLCFPEGIEAIDQCAFYCCSGLESINIPQSVKKLSNSAFVGCSELAQVHLGSAEKLRLFDAEDKLQLSICFLEAMDSFDEISSEAYIAYIKRQKKKVMEIIIDEENTEALLSVLSLKLISIKDIDGYIEAVNSRQATEMLTVLMNYKNSNFTQEQIEKEDIRRISRELNTDPFSVKEVKKNWSFAELDDGTMMIKSYKGKETEITVPERIGDKTVTVIGEYALSPEQKILTEQDEELRKKITSVILPESINGIGVGAFENCVSLISVNIPDSLINLADLAFKGTAFAKKLAKANNGFAVIKDTLVEYNGSKKRVVIPHGVKKIGGYVFSCRKGITEVIIPDSVTEIGNSAFFSCFDLKTVTVPESVTEIGETAFDYTPFSYSLISFDNGAQILNGILIRCIGAYKNVAVPDGIRKICGRAFEQNQFAEAVTVPGSVKEIGERAFYNCKKLKTVTFIGSDTDFKQNVFGKNSRNMTICAPVGSNAESYARENNIKFMPLQQ